MKIATRGSRIILSWQCFKNSVREVIITVKTSGFYVVIILHNCRHCQGTRVHRLSLAQKIQRNLIWKASTTTVWHPESDLDPWTICQEGRRQWLPWLSSLPFTGNLFVCYFQHSTATEADLLCLSPIFTYRVVPKLYVGLYVFCEAFS